MIGWALRTQSPNHSITQSLNHPVTQSPNMSSPISYKGTRWYKCDLHLHTPASTCFRDQAVSPEQWVKRAIEAGLDCVAVTDHNTGAFIDVIKEAAEGTGLTVFPGTEITCSDRKIHLLVLFNVDKTRADIEDFLIRAKIRRNEFGHQGAKTNENLETIAQLAAEEGGLVIPAHIDEYNGLAYASSAIRRDFLNRSDIHAVQVVHHQFLPEKLRVRNNEELETFLNEYYDTKRLNAPRITESLTKEWYGVVQEAKELEQTILTFSDNPHEEGDSYHGLWGMGRRYTWIKMDEQPNLESLRQALMLPKFRIRNDFDCPHSPYNKPKTWIKGIYVHNTEITAPNKEQALNVDFSPQMTTVIGGRGSGKSSILRFIRGAMNKSEELDNLQVIKDDQEQFYKIKDKKDKKGVLRKDSEICIECCRNNFLYRIKAGAPKKGQATNIVVERWNEEKKVYELLEESGMIDFFNLEIFSQKQIYAIAQEPNALRERIDRAIPEVHTLKEDLANTRVQFLEQTAKIRTIQQQIGAKGKLQMEIQDLQTQISAFQEHNIQQVLQDRQRLSREAQHLEGLAVQLAEKKSIFGELEKQLETLVFDPAVFGDPYQKEIAAFAKQLQTSLTSITQQLAPLKKEIENLEQTYNKLLAETQWQKDHEQNEQALAQIQAKMAAEGMQEQDLGNFEELIQGVNKRQQELIGIARKEEQLKLDLETKKKLQKQYLTVRGKINQARQKFLKQILSGKKVNMSANPFRDAGDFERRFRDIIQKDSGYEIDIDKIVNRCFNGLVQRKIGELVAQMHEVRQGVDSDKFSGRFRGLIRKLSDEQMDALELLFPEDEIAIKYKPNNASKFKPLSNASAGQKTSAILTFILSHGDEPLILDQPEDDLDNHLVYDLIVESLRRAKEKRQIIIVTHNANIPVNGDSELVVAMNSESRYMEVLCMGAIEHHRIKEEICDVMEGGVRAFKRRSKRYNLKVEQ